MSAQVAPRGRWQRPRAAIAAGLWLVACGGRVDSGVDLEIGQADLSLVQRVDREALEDGDATGFARADQSSGLVYGRSSSSTQADGRRGACLDDPRVLLGLVSLDACIGAELFFRESFGGNGRTCGSCHPASNNFTLDAAFIAGLPDSDPLFVAERAPELAELERPELLRQFALVLVNADGTEAPSTKFVLRSVSHTLSMVTSVTPGPVIADGLTPDFSTLPPLERTGWSGDGAPGQGRLADFPTGAVVQHATRSLAREEYVDFLPPTATQLRQIEAFQRGLGRSNEIELTDVKLSDALGDMGRRNFLFGPARTCEDCHRNAGANNVVVPGRPELANSNFDVGTETARIDALNALGMPYDGGFGTAPFDTDKDGVFDSFGNGRFNSQPLIEAADTGPFFHTNAAESIEDAIRFYTTPAFGSSPAGQAQSTVKAPGPFILRESEIDALGRFFRVLNAAFNCQQALARLQAAFEVTEAFGNQYVSIQRGLLQMAAVEMNDALEVLGAVSALNEDAQSILSLAQRDIETAASSLYEQQRASRTRDALVKVAAAKTALGTGMSFEVGESTLMF